MALCILRGASSATLKLSLAVGQESARTSSLKGVRTRSAREPFYRRGNFCAGRPADKNCSLRAFCFCYSALEALIDKPPLAPITLLAHASCLGEFEARIIGCLCCAHAPPARNTHLVLRLCGNARESGHRTDGQHCYLDDLLHLVLR